MVFHIFISHAANSCDWKLYVLTLSVRPILVKAISWERLERMSSNLANKGRGLKDELIRSLRLCVCPTVVSSTSQKCLQGISLHFWF